MPRAEQDRDAGGRPGASRALVAAGLVLLAVAVVALVAGLAGLGDDDEPGPSRGARTAFLDDDRFGVHLRHPASWRRSPERRAIGLTSPDRQVGISLTTVSSRPGVAAVRDAVDRAVVSRYRAAQVLGRGTTRVGGRPASQTAIRGRNSAGQVLDILAITVASRWRTYAIVSFGSPRAPQPVLQEARSILASLRFTRPGR